MAMPWGEFVHIEAYYFRTGEHPWTDMDFYNNSVLQRDAAPTVDPIVQIIWDWEGPRVAENDGWWEKGEGVWWGMVGHGFHYRRHLPLDTDLKLITDNVRFHFAPLTTGTGDANEPPRSLLEYECGGDGIDGTFEKHLDDIKALCDEHRKEGCSYVSLLTLWHCDAGMQYIPCEPDEYYSDWQLVGAVLPQADGVTFHRLEGDGQ